jgi:hypothetical protein
VESKDKGAHGRVPHTDTDRRGIYSTLRPDEFECKKHKHKHQAPTALDVRHWAQQPNCHASCGKRPSALRIHRLAVGGWCWWVVAITHNSPPTATRPPFTLLLPAHTLCTPHTHAHAPLAPPPPQSLLLVHEVHTAWCMVHRSRTSPEPRSSQCHAAASATQQQPVPRSSQCHAAASAPQQQVSRHTTLLRGATANSRATSSKSIIIPPQSSVKRQACLRRTWQVQPLAQEDLGTGK